MICLSIPGAPLPGSRPRVTSRGTYDPQKKEKTATKWLLRSQYSDSPSSSPLILDIQFHLPIPKSYSKKKQAAAASGELHHTSKPDIDNLLKYILDSMNGIIFTDDSHIFMLQSKKLYAEKPKTIILIYLADEIED